MKLLIVVDMQNDFIDGALGTPEAVAIVPNVKKKIAEYLEHRDCVIFTRDTHLANYLNTHEGKYLPIPHCIEYTVGWQIPKDIDVDSCLHIDKHTFGYSEWDQVRFTTFQSADTDIICDMQGLDNIEIIGLCTDICVISNALIFRALFPEKDITVDARCCAGTTLEKHKAALEVMKSCQINVVGE